VNVSLSLWAWACEQEQIYLEYFDDGDKILLKYPYDRNDVENIFPHVHGWKLNLDEMFGWKWNINEFFGW
jgi:hypothetical protein